MSSITSPILEPKDIALPRSRSNSTSSVSSVASSVATFSSASSTLDSSVDTLSKPDSLVANSAKSTSTPQLIEYNVSPGRLLAAKGEMPSSGKVYALTDKGQSYALSTTLLAKAKMFASQAKSFVLAAAAGTSALLGSLFTKTKGAIVAGANGLGALLGAAAGSVKSAANTLYRLAVVDPASKKAVHAALAEEALKKEMAEWHQS